MIYYKIYLMNNYETEQEISNRPLKRGYLKAGVNELLNDKSLVNEPFIIVFVDRDMLIHEYFTGSYLRMLNITGKSEDNDILIFNDLIKFNFERIPEDSINKYASLRANKKLRDVIRKIIFNENNDFEVTTMEELAEDRAIQFDAYTNGLTTINPYTEEYIKDKSLRLKR